MPGTHAPAEERFWRNVCDAGYCWEWTAGLDTGGYGQFKETPGESPKRAHRYSWVLHFGEIPNGLRVLHHCDNRKCVRSDHLFLGTSLNNAKDMIRKGRARYAAGEHAAHSKLTEAQAQEIRAAYVRGGVSHRALAEQYGINKSNITRLLGGRTYRG
jgi:hypothetical protein